MSWQGIIGHDRVALMFSRAFFRGRLEGSFLFTGPAGVGKRAFAFTLAKTILCKQTARLEGSGAEGLEKFVPCGECESCRLFDLRYQAVPEEIIRSRAQAQKRDAGLAPASSRRRKGEQTGSSDDVNQPADDSAGYPNHPDLYYVSRPADKTQIPLELLTGSKEERMRSGLCYDLSRTPFLENRKVAIIDDADFLNEEGANALLKTLEEPPPRSVLVLIGTSASKQLPTIRSRCQSARFFPLSTPDLAQVLLKTGEVESLEAGLRLAKVSGGSVSSAREYSDPTLEPFRIELLKELSKPFPDPVEFGAKLTAFIESEGKEPQVRRKRLGIALLRAATFYRDLARLLSGDTSVLEGNHASGSYLKKASENRPDPMLATANAERTLEAVTQIDRMANLPYIIDAWLGDLRNPVPRFKTDD